MPELLRTPYEPLPPAAFEDVVELSLLLSAEQASELEAVAFQRGVSAGEMVRRLVRDFLNAQKAGGQSVPWMFRSHAGPSKSL